MLAIHQNYYVLKVHTKVVTTVSGPEKPTCIYSRKMNVVDLS